MKSQPAYRTIRFNTIGSTHEEASRLIDKGIDEDHLMITASYQTQGIGQDNSLWFSDRGKNLLTSLIIYTSFLPADGQFMLSKAVSLAILDLLKTRHLPGMSDIKIKWPNDIYWGSEKIAGILIRNQIQGNHLSKSVISIGLNVNQEVFPGWIPNPTSILLKTGIKQDLSGIEEALKTNLYLRFKLLRDNREEILNNEYLHSLYRYNVLKPYVYQGNPILARITGINEYGHLLLQDTNGQHLECDLKEIVFAPDDQE
ncbi:MAG: biotin--[acetyl-CoA-carboxylase] ligase [Bacteroidetes bacterium]|nr:biotin--[acetyl-CoA-carboxylase] ligase [Bacteroidota bacterium]